MHFWLTVYRKQKRAAIFLIFISHCIWIDTQGEVYPKQKNVNEQIKNEEGSNDLTNGTKTKINSDNLKEGTKKENGAAY